MAALRCRTARRLGAVLALVSVAGLAGCGIFGSTPPPPCPPVGVLGDAAQLTRFLPGPGRDLTDVVFDGEILGFAASCAYSEKNSVVEVVVSLRLLATRGPAAAQARAELPYFVAVVDRLSQRVLAKETFVAQIDFPDGRRRAGSVEEIEQRIPLPSGRSGTDYEILAGFQLDEDELQFNRRRRGG